MPPCLPWPPSRLPGSFTWRHKTQLSCQLSSTPLTSSSMASLASTITVSVDSAALSKANIKTDPWTSSPQLWSLRQA
eukprot:2348791-Prymnesium_polylepis.1